jgi:hypothetical protein
MAAPISRLLNAALCAGLVFLSACGQDRTSADALRVPRGFLRTLRIETTAGIVSFGPFVGYYFAPESGSDLSRLRFVCFNERAHYTRDLPENALLFEGQARYTVLPDADFDIPAAAGRIIPLFFGEAPAAWRESRPEPRDEFLHFHSCHDNAGFVRAGFWLRHVGAAAFTYDMGGRVSPPSPLYHRVAPGPDKRFARIIEFDRGPLRKAGP